MATAAPEATTDSEMMAAPEATAAPETVEGTMPSPAPEPVHEARAKTVEIDIPKTNSVEDMLTASFGRPPIAEHFGADQAEDGGPSDIAINDDQLSLD